jgi:hypothetical protein
MKGSLPPGILGSPIARTLNGSGSTDGPVNGLGNIIIGCNQSDGDTKTGSHNLGDELWAPTDHASRAAR